MTKFRIDIKKIQDINPEEIFEKYHNDRYLIWLDSSLHNNNLGNFSIIGIKPILTVEIKNQKAKIQDPNNFLKDKNSLEKEKPNKVLRYIQQQLNQNLPNEKINLPFSFGFLGYFGYEYLHTSQNKDYLETPDGFFMIPSKCFILDHKNNKNYEINIIATNNKPQLIHISLAKSDSIINKSNKIQNISYELSYNEYKEKIDFIKSKLYEGEIYECCFTHKIFIDNLKNLETLYLKLRKENKAPFSSYLKIDNINVLSCSPERFLKIQNNQVQMRPIKGTIKRGHNDNEDKKQKAHLQNSKKDQAENIMIVDLIRNDLGRVCKFGSVKVKQLFKIEKYTSLFQMVSEIEGELHDDKDIFDLINATFPGGSMTGAPKIRAMQYIEKLEKYKRGIYSGAIGFIDFSGNADLNIVIRTLIHDEKTNKAYIQVGGAIVQDSKVKNEYEESILKGEKILEIID